MSRRIEPSLQVRDERNRQPEPAEPAAAAARSTAATAASVGPRGGRRRVGPGRGCRRCTAAAAVPRRRLLDSGFGRTPRPEDRLQNPTVPFSCRKREAIRAIYVKTSPYLRHGLRDVGSPPLARCDWNGWTVHAVPPVLPFGVADREQCGLRELSEGVVLAEPGDKILEGEDPAVHRPVGVVVRGRQNLMGEGGKGRAEGRAEGSVVGGLTTCSRHSMGAHCLATLPRRQPVCVCVWVWRVFGVR